MEAFLAPMPAFKAVHFSAPQCIHASGSVCSSVFHFVSFERCSLTRALLGSPLISACSQWPVVFLGLILSLGLLCQKPALPKLLGETPYEG